MVPGREDRLEQKCDDREQRGHPAPSLRRPFDPQTSGRLPKHAYLKPPALAHPRGPKPTPFNADGRYDIL
jgi:hypothetical protein